MSNSTQTNHWAERVREKWKSLQAAADARVWLSMASSSHLDQQIASVETRRAAGETVPLLGLTFAAKDNIDAAGFPTTAGCPAYSYQPAGNSTAVQRLQSAGAIL